MVQYIEKLFPFLENSDFIKTSDETVNISDIYCPINFNDNGNVNHIPTLHQNKKRFQACRVMPSNILVINEPEGVLRNIMSGAYGADVKINATVYDYSDVAARIEVTDGTAYMQIGTGYLMQEVVTDEFINTAANGIELDKDSLVNVSIPKGTETVNLQDWLNGFSEEEVMESADLFNELLSNVEKGKSTKVSTGEEVDNVYKWLDSYFALPEGSSMMVGGRAVVPLLIGPTGVFKSATVKELCKKYDYRLVDFRVAFTSRLDYSGLFQMGVVDDKKFSYACPMEEIITCSDGFREYCRRAYDKISQMLASGYITKSKASDGEVTEEDKEPISDEKRKVLEDLLSKYKEYTKTPVLFFDEITRCKDLGVEGLLTEMLNQKRFNNMQLQGCKFVAATNLNLRSRTNMRHNDMMEDLDQLYDVNTDLDVAYANRFMPLRVQPEDVQGRWFEWAKKEKITDTKTIQNIHPLILEYLDANPNMVYNDTPVLDAIEKDLTDNEQKAQSYPNYRTWDMLSGYMYQIDKEYELELAKASADATAASGVQKLFKRSVINGLISSWAGEKFMAFLTSKGYAFYEDKKGEVDDEYTDFLETALSSNVPALMIGPSSMGKTSRVKSYIKHQKEKTGLEPILINIDLSAKDVVDLMGMPSKVSILDYVAGEDVQKVPEVGRELSSIIKSVCEESKYGLSDIITVRAPDKEIKDSLTKAKAEGREVVFFLDEVNRVKNTSVLSAAFEIISDSRFAGVSFKDMAGKVKVIAACNMAHSEMDDEMETYGSAGAIDPALAARFSIFWKKHYDAKDVRSWIAYMEEEKKEGRIDGTLLEYFKTLDVDDAVRIIASVEKRQLAYAQPSTRNLHQLSMDIKSMRGKADSTDAKLFYGKLLFDKITREELGNIYETISGKSDEMDAANRLIKLIKELLLQRDVWEALISKQTVSLNGKEASAEDLLDNLQMCVTEIEKLIVTPLDSSGRARLQSLNMLAVDLLRACNDIDDIISQSREAIFEAYVGEEFASKFTPFFNEAFGSDGDEEITIEMLSDKTLVKPFFRKYRALRTNLTEEKYEDSILDLMEEFLKVHGTSLNSDVYAAFIDGACASLASNDGTERILKKANSSVDKLFERAEGVGDAWILSMLSYTRITQADIDRLRAALSSSGSTTRTRKSVIL